MTTRPTRYYLEWDEGDEDTTLPAYVDAPGELQEARTQALAASRTRGLTVAIIERVHVEDVTPPGDPAGLVWDYGYEFVEDVTA